MGGKSAIRSLAHCGKRTEKEKKKKTVPVSSLNIHGWRYNPKLPDIELRKWKNSCFRPQDELDVGTNRWEF